MARESEQVRVGDLVQQDYPPHTLDIQGCYDYRSEARYSPDLLGIVLKIFAPLSDPMSVEVLWSNGKTQTVYADQLVRMGQLRDPKKEASCE